MMPSLFLLIFLLSTLTFTVGQNVPMIPNVKVEYDGTVNLTCSDSGFDPDKVNLNHDVDLVWLLPNGDLIKDTDTHDRVKVTAKGRHLMILRADNIDFGVYNCIVKVYGDDGTRYVTVQKGVNMSGPYWGDLVAKYRMRMIVGFVTAAAMLVLMLGFCWVMNQNREAEVAELKRMEGIPHALWASQLHGKDNMAVEVGDIELHERKSPLEEKETPPPEYDSNGDMKTKM